ncbi:hypothetical protein WJX73_007546 [Symbiochloris irregularis]|uniref:Uncharacterized protein n=1 Tax=Symbiochloris irregularis TaxID=706552 RepID=A0AAW1P4M0_9CHLO
MYGRSSPGGPMALPACDVARMVQKEPWLLLCMNQDKVVEQVARNWADSGITHCLADDKAEYYTECPRSLFDSNL